MEHFPERLKSARKMRGYSLRGLAEAMEDSLSKQSLQKYEAGKMKPDNKTLIKLCEVLQLPQDYFTRETKVNFDKISFRKLDKLPKRTQYKIEEQTRDFLERYLELEELMGQKPDFVNPIKNLPIQNKSAIEEAASKIRKEWELGEDPLYNVLGLLEEQNIKILEVDEDVSFSGMSTNVDERIPVIVLNRNKNIPHDRLRFTALHELGHLVLNIQHYPEKEQERLCHAFAGAMLIPKGKMFEELGKHRHRIFMKELMFIKDNYGISMQALTHRAKDLEIISQHYHKYFMIRFNQKGYRREEPYGYKGAEHSHRFLQLIIRGIAEEIISTSKGASLYNGKLFSFRKMILSVA